VTIDHDAEEPLYLQLAAILRGQIESGELERRVPSVKTLTQQYEVAQGTAERALAVLREEGPDPVQDGPRSLRRAARRARLSRGAHLAHMAHRIAPYSSVGSRTVRAGQAACGGVAAGQGNRS